MHCNPGRRIRISEAVRASGIPITPGHVARLIRRGTVPATRIGGLWFVDPDELRSVMVKPANANEGAAS